MPITINGTTGISGVDGSAGSPAVIGSDADTGLVFAAGQVSASINGVTGNVPLVSGTAQNSTSGTSIDFTGIPSWVKRVTVMFNGVSTNGLSGIRVQLGTSSGLETTGYNGSTVRTAGASLGTVTISSGFDIGGFGVQTETQNGQFIISLFQASSNTWACSGSLGGNAVTNTTAGIKSLASTLTQLRITTVNGTDTFDAGAINILYE